MRTVREHYLHPVGRGAVYVRHRHAEPRVHESAYVAPTAVLCGDVVVGPHSRILFGAVLTAEGGPVEIGSHCVIMEHAVVRGTPRRPARIGDHVLVGPHAHLTGCVVDGDARIATGSVVFTGAHLERGAVVESGAVVQVNTVVPAGVAVPMGWFAGGDPAELIPPAEWERIRDVMGALDYPGTVFGAGRAADGSGMSDIATRYARGLALHRYDELVEERPVAPPAAGDQRPGQARSRAAAKRVVPLPE